MKRRSQEENQPELVPVTIQENAKKVKVTKNAFRFIVTRNTSKTWMEEFNQDTPNQPDFTTYH